MPSRLTSVVRLVVLAVAGVAVPAAGQGAPSPRTRAERSGDRETSTYADVRAFLDAIIVPGGPLVLDSLGRTHEGRLLPLVIASRPAVHTPAEARTLGRPVSYVQANIHAGEVEGKEAMQALLRDLAAATGTTILDSIVLVVVPIYNADGNERLADQRLSRGEQNGPAAVGQRPNAMGLDLNRDYVKSEAPESRGFHAAVNAWDPDRFLDLHTTDGSFHGYVLTWSPSLHPSSPLTPFVRDSLLPRIAERLETRTAIRTFPYGNFSNGFGRDAATDTVKPGWYSYDHRPRFGTNYMGLRNRVSILVEARDTAVVRALALHGVTVQRFATGASLAARGWIVDSVVRAERSFQGHREVRLVVHAEAAAVRTIPAGTYWVRGRQRLARMAALLLEPLSDDGLVNWNALDDRIAVGQPYPLRAAARAPAVAILTRD